MWPQMGQGAPQHCGGCTMSQEHQQGEESQHLLLPITLQKCHKTLSPTYCPYPGSTGAELLTAALHPLPSPTWSSPHQPPSPVSPLLWQEAPPAQAGHMAAKGLPKESRGLPSAHSALQVTTAPPGSAALKTPPLQARTKPAQATALSILFSERGCPHLIPICSWDRLVLQPSCRQLSPGPHHIPRNCLCTDICFSSSPSAGQHSWSPSPREQRVCGGWRGAG